MEGTTSLEKPVYISIKIQLKPFDLHPERRWKTYRWKIINFINLTLLALLILLTFLH